MKILKIKCCFWIPDAHFDLFDGYAHSQLPSSSGTGVA